MVYGLLAVLIVATQKRIRIRLEDISSKSKGITCLNVTTVVSQDPFSNFLKDHVPHVYDEYVMERYKEGTIGKNVPKPDLTQFISKPKFEKRTVDLEPLSRLNNFHVAKKYILDRGIPENKLDRLYYVLTSRNGLTHRSIHSRIPLTMKKELSSP